MTAAITEAAAPLLEKVESVHRLLFRTAHLCARSQLHNLRRELERAMEDLRVIKDGLSLPGQVEIDQPGGAASLPPSET